jgi:hypothetical protein
MAVVSSASWLLLLVSRLTPTGRNDQVAAFENDVGLDLPAFSKVMEVRLNGESSPAEASVVQSRNIDPGGGWTRSVYTPPVRAFHA